jgi:hypothetical protein
MLIMYEVFCCMIYVKRECVFVVRIFYLMYSHQDQLFWEGRGGEVMATFCTRLLKRTGESGQTVCHIGHQWEI